MTLYDLVSNVILQGNIRVSSWCDDEETVHLIAKDNDFLHIGHFDKSLRTREVTYMFAAADGYLHIEIESKGEHP